jgi:uncharacterized YigZ family protein
MKIIYKNGTDEIVEKKSRFIANVFKVESEEQAVDIINNMKKKFWDARHNCYAYIIGNNNEVQKFSDDGEPSGTAGKPIMDIILSEKIHNCLIVVTRYFGGTLLGTGGLIRAYQEASKKGIAQSEVIDAIEGVSAYIDTDYNNMGKIQYICAEQNVLIEDIEYTDKVHIKLLIPKEYYMQFVHIITDRFSGNVEVIENGEQKYSKMASGEVILL